MKHENFAGTLRIFNPKTLEKWIKDGRYQKLIDEGWIFNKGCGRFKKNICTCRRCRKNKCLCLKKDI